MAIYVILDELSVRLTVLVKTLSGMCVEAQELSRVTVGLSPDESALFEADDQIMVLRVNAALDTSRVKDTLFSRNMSVLNHSSIAGERILDFVEKEELVIVWVEHLGLPIRNTLTTQLVQRVKLFPLFAIGSGPRVNPNIDEFREVRHKLNIFKNVESLFVDADGGFESWEGVALVLFYALLKEVFLAAHPLRQHRSTINSRREEPLDVSAIILLLVYHEFILLEIRLLIKAIYALNYFSSKCPIYLSMAFHVYRAATYGISPCFTYVLKHF